MTKQEIISNLKMARQYIIDTLPFATTHNLALNKNESLNGSGTHDFGYEFIYMHVGYEEIEKASNNTELDDYTMMIPLVALFHESFGHGCQLKQQFNQTDTLSKALALNTYACKCSCAYSDGENLQQYFKQPNEIAAQYAGIKYAYGYCVNVFGQEKASKLICDYVNHRIENNSEFISYIHNKPYDNVNDILNEFNKTFKNNLYAHRTWSKQSLTTNLDPIHDYFKHKTDNKQIFMLEHCRNGMVQDLMLSSIYLYQEDKNDYLKTRVPALKDANSIPKAFSFADKPKWIRSRDRNVDLAELTANIQPQNTINEQYMSPAD